MKKLIILFLCFSNFVFANEVMSPEDYFVEGSNLLKPESKNFDPDKGLRYMLFAANRKYEHAPFGLCIALSHVKEILDIEHAYVWCYVATKIDNKFSEIAYKRLVGIGMKIQNEGGWESLELVKKRARETYGD